MRDSEVLARCQKKTEAVCPASGRRFKIADLGVGVFEVPHMQHVWHPAAWSAMSEEEKQAAVKAVLPKEKELFERERERFIAMDAAAVRERESAERAAAERAAAEQAALSPPASPPVSP